jgi:hypothetical protein
MSQLLLQKEQPQECPEVFVATAALFLCCPCAAKLCNKHLISARIHSDHFICRTWREITNSRKTEGKEFYPTGGLGKLMTDAIEVTRAQSLMPLCVLPQSEVFYPSFLPANACALDPRCPTTTDVESKSPARALHLSSCGIRFFVLQVWLCVKKPACLSELQTHMPHLIGEAFEHGHDFMCYVFHEQKETFIPWYMTLAGFQMFNFAVETCCNL